MSKKKATKKKSGAAPLPSAGGPCRHPLTDITAAVHSLWDYDKVMARPESRAAARQASNAFDIALAGLAHHVGRLLAWRKEGAYATVQG